MNGLFIPKKTEEIVCFKQCKQRSRLSLTTANQRRSKYGTSERYTNATGTGYYFTSGCSWAMWPRFSLFNVYVRRLAGFERSEVRSVNRSVQNKDPH